MWDKVFIGIVVTISSLWSYASTQDTISATAEIYHDSGGVLEGEETTFFCLVSNIADDDIVRFSHNDITLSENTRILGTDGGDLNYKVVRVDGRSFVRFYLTVTVTSRANSGKYGCHIVSSASGNAVISSSYASLAVYYLPVTSYPTCVISDSSSARTSMTLVEGDEVTLSCTSDSGQPSVSLQWNDLVGADATSSVSVSEGVMAHKITVQPQDGAILACQMVVDKDIFGVNETNRECSIGPFTVLPRPLVAVEPIVRRETIGSTALFRCNIEGTHGHSRVTREWFTYPDIPEDRLFVSVDKTAVLIQNVSLADNKTVVLCRMVTNLVSVEASGMLKVLVPQEEQMDQGSEGVADVETTSEYPHSSSTGDNTDTLSNGWTTENPSKNTTRDSTSESYYRTSDDTNPRLSSTVQTDEETMSSDWTRRVNPSQNPQDLIGRTYQVSDGTNGNLMASSASCQLDVNSLAPYITAILVATTVALLAIIVDIFLVLKLFQRKNNNTVPL